MVFAEFDVTDEDPPDEHASWMASHVPSIVLAPKGGGSPIVYATSSAAIDIVSVTAWLRERCPEFVTPNTSLVSPSPVKRSSQKRDSIGGGTPMLVSQKLPPIVEYTTGKPPPVETPVVDFHTALVTSPQMKGGALAAPEPSESQMDALRLLQSSLSSAAAAGTQQLEALRRVGPTTAASGKAFLKTSGVVLKSHAETYATALEQLEGADDDDLAGMKPKLISAAMGMQRDAASQQLSLLQELAGSSPAFDSDEFVALLEESALRMSRLATAHVGTALSRLKR